MQTTIVEGKSIKQTMDELLTNPQPVTVERLCVGEVLVKKSGMEKTKSKETELIPVYVYLVHHSKKGYFLIDAGLDSSFIEKPYGSQKGLLRNFVACKAYQQPEQNIKQQLVERGITLNGVFLSHLHFDHAAGLIDLEDQTTCTVGIGEKDSSVKPFYYGAFLKHIKTIETIDFSECTKLDPLNEAVDYFGDGSLIIISTPGHTSGHISFLVNGKEPWFIACDAYGYNRASLIENGPGTFSADFETSKQTLNGILAFAKKYPSIKIYTGHGE